MPTVRIAVARAPCGSRFAISSGMSGSPLSRRFKTWRVMHHPHLQPRRETLARCCYTRETDMLWLPVLLVRSETSSHLAVRR